MDRLEDRVVPGVGEAVIAAHHHMIAAAVHLVIHRQAVLRHAAHRVVLLHHLPAIAAQRPLLFLRQRQGGGHRLQQHRLRGDGVGAAAEVGVDGLLQQLRTEQAGVALCPGEHHRLLRRHGLQRGAGDPHEQVAGGCHDVDIRPGAGQHHTGAAQLQVHLLGLPVQLLKHIPAAGDQDPHPGRRPVKLGRQLNELPGCQGAGLIQPADMADHRVIPQAELLPHRLPGDPGRKFLRIDPVDGQGNVSSRDPVLLDQIVPDVLAHRQSALPPVGQQLQHPADLEHPVAGGDEGEPQLPLEGAAQKGWDPGVGVDDVRPLLPQDPPEQGPGAEHIPHAAPVHGDGVVPDPRRLYLGHIYAAVGGNDHLMSPGLQLLGQLHDVGLRAADAQPHGRHKDLHGSLTDPRRGSGGPQWSPQNWHTGY